MAIECSDQQSLYRFCTTILGIPKIKDMMLSNELSIVIFGINKNVPIEICENGKPQKNIFSKRFKF
jgi:hypothetical protein